MGAPRGGFEGRCCLVTGAASGMGRAAAELFARRGGRVIALDRNAGALDVLASGWREARLDIHPVVFDQADLDDIARAFGQVDQLTDRLDVCFANAGFGKYGPALDVTPRDWRRHVDINLTGTFFVAQAAARRMVQHGRGGSIVLNASTGASTPTALFSAYCASKGGLLILGRILASELGPHRIRVNVIMPGTIETSMTESILADEQVRAMVEADTPTGEIGRAEDVAQAVAFLCGDEARYINGTTLVIDGGQTVNGQPRWFRTDYRDPSAGWKLNTAGS